MKFFDKKFYNQNKRKNYAFTAVAKVHIYDDIKRLLHHALNAVVFIVSIKEKCHWDFISFCLPNFLLNCCFCCYFKSYHFYRTRSGTSCLLSCNRLMRFFGKYSHSNKYFRFVDEIDVK